MVALTISALPGILKATDLSVDVGTGGDDLRGGNTAYLRVTLLNGTVTSEQVLSRGFAGNSLSVGNLVSFPETFSSSQIRSIRLRHDGNPRSGYPFDTYDNWNLRYLRIRLGAATIYDSERDTLFYSDLNSFTFFRKEIRFTGSLRQMNFFINPHALEADFTITGITRDPALILAKRVAYQNIGYVTGRLLGINCWDDGAGIGDLGGTGTEGIFVPALGIGQPIVGSYRSTTCLIWGTESVTRNNVFRLIL